MLSVIYFQQLRRAIISSMQRFQRYIKIKRQKPLLLAGLNHNFS